ncbi:MAG: hypothetical protein ABSF92_06200 [Candidatus Acidiferrales bacterium]
MSHTARPDAQPQGVPFYEFLLIDYFAALVIYGLGSQNWDWLFGTCHTVVYGTIVVQKTHWPMLSVAGLILARKLAHGGFRRLKGHRKPTEATGSTTA